MTGQAPRSAREIKEAQVAAEAGMSDEQKQLRDLQDQLAHAKAREMELLDEKELREAEAAARNVDESVDSVSPVGDHGVSKPGNILINFVDDGWSHLDRTYVRGEEQEFDPESEEYKLTQDKNGKSWVTLSEGEQLDKHGKIFFRQGPWRGKSLADSQMDRLLSLADEEGISLPSQAQLIAAERKTRTTGRRPPRI